MKLDTLLNQFGIPPPEVCVDWALQIREMIRKEAGAEHADTASDRDLKNIWQQLDVDETGVLSVTSHLSTVDLNIAREELARWCEQSQQGVDPTSFPGLREVLRAAKSNTDVSEVALVANVAIAERNSSAPQRKKKVPSAQGRNKIQSRNRIGVVTAILFLSAIGVLAIVMTGPLSTRNAHELASSKSSPTEGADTSATSSYQLTSNPTAHSRTEPNVPNLELSNSSELIESSNHAVVDQVLATDGLLSNAILSPSALAPSVVADADANRVSTGAESMSNKSAAESTQSVLTEIQSTLQQAEKEIQEAELRHSPDGAIPTAAGNQPTTMHPFVLELQSMRVSLKLNKILATVPKEPVWRLRLTAVDGFVVSPAAEQSLDSRGVIAWSVHEETAESPRTKIIVQVRQAGGRKGDLAWRVLGSADDIPTLGLPLNRKWLEPLHASLRRFAQSLLITQDQLLQQSRQSGLPSNVRTALSNRRQWANQQSKLLDRSNSVIAEVNRLVGLLDNQFEVTGELVDGNAVNAPVFLRLKYVDQP